MPRPTTEKGKKAAATAYKICSDKPTGSAAKENCVMGVYNDKMMSNNNKGMTTKGKKKK